MSALEAVEPHTEPARWQRAREAVEQAWTALATPAKRNAVLRTELGWRENRPTTHATRCPIDTAALRAFLLTPLARTQPLDDSGTPKGGPTLGQQAEAFLANVTQSNEDTGYVDIAYTYAEKGWALIKSGHLTYSREYAKGADPFELPKVLRHIALARFGFDFDDAGSYPRAGACLISAGRSLCQHFLQYREHILAEIGKHFFPSLSQLEQRRRAKRLTNLLDMDGSYGSWRAMYGVDRGRRIEDLHIVTPDGRPFDAHAYIKLQPERTRELAHRFTRANDIVRQSGAARPELTLKSYIFQEYEARSRTAKLRWTERRGHQWINLQHDGVVIALKQGTSGAEACSELTQVCSRALGYTQPVEVKMMQAGAAPQPAARTAPTAQNADTWHPTFTNAPRRGSDTDKAIWEAVVACRSHGENYTWVAPYTMFVARPSNGSNRRDSITLPAIMLADTHDQRQVRKNTWILTTTMRRGFHIELDAPTRCGDEVRPSPQNRGRDCVDITPRPGFLPSSYSLSCEVEDGECSELTEHSPALGSSTSCPQDSRPESHPSLYSLSCETSLDDVSHDDGDCSEPAEHSIIQGSLAPPPQTPRPEFLPSSYLLSCEANPGGTDEHTLQGGPTDRPKTPPPPRPRTHARPHTKPTPPTTHCIPPHAIAASGQPAPADPTSWDPVEATTPSASLPTQASASASSTSWSPEEATLPQNNVEGVASGQHFSRSDIVPP